LVPNYETFLELEADWPVAAVSIRYNLVSFHCVSAECEGREECRAGRIRVGAGSRTVGEELNLKGVW
jgi:hypothetical protein